MFSRVSIGALALLACLLMAFDATGGKGNGKGKPGAWATHRCEYGAWAGTNGLRLGRSSKT